MSESSERLSESEIQAIVARCEAATPGPWHYDGMHDEITAPYNEGEQYWLIISEGHTAGLEHEEDEFGHRFNDDFAFIAHAREDVPALLTEVERLREQARLSNVDWAIAVAELDEKEKELGRERARAEAAEARLAAVRPEVMAFAVMMEARLRANDHKGGWQDCNRWWLLRRLQDEVAELVDAMSSEEGQPRIGDEAADVANFALMIADVSAALAAAADEGKEKNDE